MGDLTVNFTWSNEETPERPTLRPLKLILPGRFWDSYIYSGRLYLFGLDGNLVTLDWDNLIEQWPIDEDLRVAFECAFRQSDFLYGSKFSRLFKDNEIRSVVRRKFEKLGEDLEVSQTKFDQLTVRQQPSPFPFPHTDLTVYRNHFYVTSNEGVYSSRTNKKKASNPVSSRIDKKWDGSAFSLAASYNSLALAAGDEGLFEMSIDEDGWEPSANRDPHRVARGNCTACQWAFHSVYCSSHVESGYLAAFKKETRGEAFYSRSFDRVIPSEQIFQNGNGYSWGNQDKICQVNDHLVRIVRYRPRDEVAMEDLGFLDMEGQQDAQTIELAPWKGGVVSGGIALFGTIVECRNAVVVIPSEGPPITLRGEPTNWRIFPRSVQYENQLHVIYRDRMEILSFNHDYFVDQETKRSGVNELYLELRTRGGRRFPGRRGGRPIELE